MREIFGGGSQGAVEGRGVSASGKYQVSRAMTRAPSRISLATQVACSPQTSLTTHTIKTSASHINDIP